MVVVAEVDRHFFEVRKRPRHDVDAIQPKISVREGCSYSLGDTIGRLPAACLTGLEEVFAELAVR